MKENYFNKLIISVIIIVLSLSIYSYLLDCILNFEHAIKYVLIFFWYITHYLISRSWIFVIYIIAYYYFFRNTKQGQYISLKIIVSVVIFCLLSRSLSKDDISLTIGEYKKIRISICYCLAVTTMIFFNEYHPYFKKY
jgi:hypothetical protein